MDDELLAHEPRGLQVQSTAGSSRKDGKFNAFRNIVHCGLRFTDCFAVITQFAEVVGPELFGTLVMATLPTHELLGLQVQPSSGTSRRPVNFPLFRSYIPLFHTTVVAAGTAGQQRLHIRPPSSQHTLIGLRSSSAKLRCYPAGPFGAR